MSLGTGCTDAHGQELTDTDPAPKPCVFCERDNPGTDPMTTNRAPYSVHGDIHLGALCKAHDTNPLQENVARVAGHGGAWLLTEAIEQGVFTVSEVRQNVPLGFQRALEEQLERQLENDDSSRGL